MKICMNKLTIKNNGANINSLAYIAFRIIMEGLP